MPSNVPTESDLVAAAYGICPFCETKLSGPEAVDEHGIVYHQECAFRKLTGQPPITSTPTQEPPAHAE